MFWNSYLARVITLDGPQACCKVIELANIFINLQTNMHEALFVCFYSLKKLKFNRAKNDIQNWL